MQRKPNNQGLTPEVWRSQRIVGLRRDFVMNYIHHSPVKHGYTMKWQEWPYSNAAAYIESVGREKAETIWRQYPVRDYGKDWDV